MRCLKCNAEDGKFFMDGVCRRCIHLQYGMVEDYDHVLSDGSDYSLSFELNPFQKQIAQKIVENIIYRNVYVEAVCGAGKTEMCYELIKYCLDHKLVIVWAIPRRQVVLELKERLAENFKEASVVAVCEGFTDNLIGDIIICTTHQLYRYHNLIDVLIVDEPDAFPFSKNDLLLGIMQKSVKGNILFMSATKDEGMLAVLKDPVHLKMPLRPNLKPLPIPILRKSYVKLLFDITQHKDQKQLFFVPTIKLANILSKLFSIPCITSKTDDKEAVLKTFMGSDDSKLISTTILERGVTFVDVFVYILEAHHPVFDASSLIQITGRILRGRSTVGACYMYSIERSLGVEQCINDLHETNQHAEYVLENGI